MADQHARAAGLEVAVGSVGVPRTCRGWIHKARIEGLIKGVADARRGVLVGGTGMVPAGG